VSEILNAIEALRANIKSSKAGTTAVDLGCGTQPRNPLDCDKVIGLDIIPSDLVGRFGKEFEYRKLARGRALPIENDSIDAVYAFDFIEHLSRQPDHNGGEFISTMNEIWRVLSPSGVLVAATPCWPSKAVFSDPTHTNPISDQTHLYFSDHVWARKNGYGFIGSFRTIAVGWTSPHRHPSLWDRASKHSAQVGDGKISGLRAAIKRAKRDRAEPPNHFLWVLVKDSIS
jgi:SAM-dependent methyltransferase